MSHPHTTPLSMEVCLRLQHNDPSLIDVSCLGGLHDEGAIMLGNVLRNNTFLRRCMVQLHLPNFPGLTTQGAKALADGFRRSHLTSVEINSGDAVSNVARGAEKSEVMALLWNGIQQSSTIRHLRVFAPVGDIHAFVTMFSSLQTLEMWFMYFTNDMAHYFHAAISKSTTSLEEISITFHDRTCTAASALLSALAVRTKPLNKLLFQYEGGSTPFHNLEEGETIRCNFRQMIGAGKTPKDLQVVGCDFLPEDVKVLGDDMSLSSCRLSSLSISETSVPLGGGGMALAEVAFWMTTSLRTNQSLVSLRLSSCQLGNEDMTMLVRGLMGDYYNGTTTMTTTRQRSSITTLELDNNHIGDQGMTALASLLCHSSCNVRQLNLNGNNIGTGGVQKLMQALSSSHHHNNKSTLEKLSLADNGKIGYKGLVVIGKALPNLRLRSLDIHECASTTCDDDEWEEANMTTDHVTTETRDDASRALIQGMDANIYLYELDVAGNELGWNVLNKIRFYVNVNQCGRYLLANREHEFAPSIWSDVLAHCGDHPSLVYFFLQQQRMLV